MQNEEIIEGLKSRGYVAPEQEKFLRKALVLRPLPAPQEPEVVEPEQSEESEQ